MKIIAVTLMVVGVAGCSAIGDIAGSDTKPVSVERPAANILQSTVLTADMSQVAVIESSDITLDCAGHSLNNGMEIHSRRVNDQWIPPKNVTVKNCVSRGGIRVYGMARNGEDSNLTESSKQPGHTQRVQAAAPSNIRFENIQSHLTGATGFYFAPGVTHSELVNSQLEGNAVSVAIYLDAESAYNRIANNRIAVETSKREQIAVDGSAHNQIVGNQFTRLKNGGIYLYRNCGEGGNARHQTPSENLIADNVFQHTTTGDEPDIWLASRNGNRLYCYKDMLTPYGSGASDLDYATNNIIENNTFINQEQIRVDAQPNIIRGNKKQ